MSITSDYHEVSPLQGWHIDRYQFVIEKRRYSFKDEMCVRIFCGMDFPVCDEGEAKDTVKEAPEGSAS